MRSRLYYKWHLSNLASPTHWAALSLFIVAVATLGFFSFYPGHFENPPMTKAVDATFGNTHAGTAGGEYLFMNTFGTLYTSPADCGDVTKISVYLNETYQATSGSVAIYKHSDLSRVAISGTVNWNVMDYTWVDFPITATLTPNTEYILAFEGGYDGYIKYDTGSANQGHKGNVGLGDPINFSTHSTNNYSIYATYTPSAPPATYSISGTVTVGGSGLSGVLVDAGGGHTDTTIGDGTYTISGLSDGAYTLTPSKTGYAFTPTTRSENVSGADINGADFAATATETFGNTSDGSMGMPINGIQGTKFTSPADCGNIVKLTAKIGSADSNTFPVIAAIYKASDQSLVAQSSPVTIPASYNNWIDFTVSTTLTPNTDYYLVVLMDDSMGNHYLEYDFSQNNFLIYEQSRTYAQGFPTTSNLILTNYGSVAGNSIYATYTPSTPAGITISGTAKQYDEATNAANSETVKVAINGTLQAQTGTTASGTWSITGVTAPASGDTVTVFIDGVADGLEANAVTKYDGTGDITDINLFEKHLSLGSADNQTLSNNDISKYDNSVSTDEDIFFEVDGSNNLTLPATSTQTDSDQKLIVKASNTWRPASSGAVTSTVPMLTIPTSATVTMDANTLAFTGTGTPLSITGTFTANTSTVKYTGAGNTTITAADYNHLETSPSAEGGGGGYTYTFADAGSDVNAADYGQVTDTWSTGQNVYYSPTKDRYIYHAGPAWFVTVNPGFGNTYYNNTNTARDPDPPLTTDAVWEVTGAGSSPAPTVTRTANPSTYTFAAGTINVVGNYTNGDATHAVITTADTNDPTLNIDGNFSNSAGATFVQSASGTFSVAKNFTNASGATYTKGGTLTFDGDSAGVFTDSSSPLQNIGVVYQDKTSTTTSNNKITLASSMTVDRYRVNGTSGQEDTLDLASSGYTFIIMGSGDNVGNNRPLRVDSGATLSGNSNSTVEYKSAALTAIANNPTYNNLKLNASGTTFMPMANLSVSGVFTIDTGTIFDAQTWTVTLSGSGTPFVVSGTFSEGTSTIKYTGSSATNVTGTTYSNLYLDYTGTTFTAVNNITASSVLTINAGTFDASNKTITLSGSGTPFVINGTFIASTSTIKYTGAGDTTVAAATYYNLETSPSAEGAAGSGGYIYTVSGAGSAVNASDYAYYGNSGGDNQYYSATVGMYMYFSNGNWWIGPTLNAVPTLYRNPDTSTTPDPALAGWQIVTGNSPAPTIVTRTAPTTNYVYTLAGAGFADVNATDYGQVTDTWDTGENVYYSPTTGYYLWYAAGVWDITATPGIGTTDYTNYINIESPDPTLTTDNAWSWGGNPLNNPAPTVTRVANPSAYTYTFASGTINTNNYTNGDATHAVITTADTNDPILNIDGNFSNSAGATFTASASGAFSVASNFTNSATGTFTDSAGTLTFDGQGLQTITAGGTDTSHDFKNITITNADSVNGISFADSLTATGTFTDTTASSKLTFNATSTYTIAAISINGGAVGTRIQIHSSSSGSPFSFVVSGANPTASYVDVKDSNATGSSAHINATTGGLDSTGNTYWDFPAAGITISGTAYTDDTKNGTINSCTNCVGLSINGGAKTLASTDGSGVYSFASQTVAANDTITLYLTGGTYTGNLVTQAIDASTDITGQELYANDVVLSNQNAAPMTNTLLATANNCPDCGSDIKFTDSAGAITFTTGYKVWIFAGKTYTPGNTVTVDFLNIAAAATFVPEGNTITFTGSGTPFGISGTFTAGSSTIKYTGAGDTTIAATTYHNLETSPSAEGGGGGYLVAGAGDTSYNGTYTLVGNDVNGNPYYTMGSGGSQRWMGNEPWSSTNHWMLCNHDNHTSGSWDDGASAPYVNYGSVTPDLGTWTQSAWLPGPLPAPTVTASASAYTYTFASGTANVSNNYTNGDGTHGVITTADTNDPTLNIDGNFSNSAGATFVQSASGTFSIAKNFTNASGATYTKGGILTLDGDSPGIFTDSSSPLQNIGVVYQNKTSTTTSNNKITLASSMTVDSYRVDGTSGQEDTFDLTSFGYTLLILGSGQGNNRPIRVDAGASMLGDTNSTVEFQSSSATDIANLPQYYNLKLNHNGTTFTAYGDTTISGVLNVQAGTYNANSRTITLSGSGTPFVITGTFTASTSTIKYTGAGNTTITATTYYNLETSPSAEGGGGWTVSGSGTVGVDGTYIENGTSGGKPAYSCAETAMWLYWNTANSRWEIYMTKQAAWATYYGTGTDLPASPWNVGVGSPPAPTVAAVSTPYTYTFASGTINVGGNYTNGDGTHTVNTTADTNDPTLNIDGNYSNSAGATFVASASGSFSVASNFTNSATGTFTDSAGTLTFDGQGLQTITAGGTDTSHDFKNITITNADSVNGISFADSLTATGTFTDTTASSKLTFHALSTYTIAAITINGQAAGTKIVMVSSDPANGNVENREWFLNVSGASPGATFVNVTDSDAGGGNAITPIFSTDGGNNENWLFGLTISGTAKQYNESSDVADSETVKVAINGTIQAQTGSTSGGTWSISGVTAPSVGDTITVFIDGVADANEANAVTKYDGSGNITGINLFEKHLSIGSDDNQTLSNNDISKYDNSVSGDEDIFFEVDGSNYLVLPQAGTQTATDQKLIIKASNTYRPASGGGVSSAVPILSIPATAVVILDSNTLTLTGIGTVLAISGTFNSNSSTVNYVGDSATFVASTTYYNLNLDRTGTTFTAAGNITVTGVLTVNAGTFSTLGNYFELTGSGTPLVIHDTFTSSIVQYTGSSATNITATTYNDLVLDHAGTTFTAAGDFTVQNAFTIQSGTFDASNKTITLSKNTTGPMFYVYGTFTPSTSTIKYTGSGASGVTSTTYYNLWTGTPDAFALGNMTVTNVFTINSGTFEGSNVTITLSGTTGTPFVKTGTFSAQGSTVKYTGNFTGGNTNVVATTYNDLYLDNASETYIAAGDITATNVFTINAGIFDASNRTIHLTLSGTSNPSLVITGTFTPSTSTISYEGGGSVSITATTYYNLVTAHTSSYFKFLGSTTVTGTFTDVAAPSTLDFNAGSTFDFNTVSIAGTAGNLITMEPANGATDLWFFHPTTVTQVSYVGVSWSSNTGTSFCATYSSDGGHNTAWNISSGGSCVTTISLSGTAKQYNESSNVADSETVKVAVNGVLQAQTGTTSGGTWSISGVTQPSSGDTVTVFIDGVADANEAIGVTKYDGTGDITGINLFEKHLSFGSDDNQTISNADMEKYDHSVSSDEDIFFEVNDSTKDLTLPETGTQTDTDQKLIVKAGNTWQPSASTSPTSTVPNLVIPATATVNLTDNTLVLASSGDPLSITGTLTIGTSTIKFQGSSATNVNAITYNNLYAADHTGVTFTAAGDITVNGVLTINAGTFDASSRTITLSGSGTPFVKTGTFTPSTSTVKYTGAGNTTIAATTYYNLETSPSAGSGDWVVSGAGDTSYNGTYAESGDVGGVPAYTNGLRWLWKPVSFPINNAYWALTSSKGAGLPAVYAGKLGDPALPANPWWPDSSAPPTPTVSAAPSTTYTFASGTINTNNYINGDGTNAVITTADTNDPILNIDGNFTNSASSTFTASATAIFSVGGNFINNASATFTHSSGTLTLDGGSTQSITTGGDSLYNVTVTNTAGEVSQADATTIAGTLTINASAIYDINGQNIILTTLDNNGIFRLQGGETTVTITNKDTTHGTIEYDGTGSYTGFKYGNIYNHLEFHSTGAGSWAMNAIVTVNGTMTMNAGTLTFPDAGSQSITCNSLVYDGGTITIAAQGVAGRVKFTTNSYSQSAGVFTLGNYAETDVNGAFALNGGTFSAGSFSRLYISGDFSDSGGTMSQNSNARIYFDGNMNSAINSAPTFTANFYINKGASYALTLNCDITVGNFYISSGNINTNAKTITATANVSDFNANGQTINKLTINGNTVNIQGSVTIDTTLIVNTSKKMTINGSSVVTLTDTVTTTLNGTMEVYYTSSGYYLLKDNAISNFPLTGTFAGRIKLQADTKDITIPARIYLGRVEVLNFGSTPRVATLGTTTGQSITIGGNSWDDYLYSGLYLAANSTGNITLEADTYDPNIIVTTYSVLAEGNIGFIGTGDGSEIINAGNSTWTVKGDIDFTGGTFTKGSSTVILNGTGANQTQNITSTSNSFNNLTIQNNATNGTIFADSCTVTGTLTDTTPSSKLTFHSGSTYAFSTVNIVGTAGNLITLAPSGGTNWVLNPTTITNVTYVDVSRSTNSGTSFCAGYSHDGLNNIGWHISAGATCDPPAAPTGVAIGSIDSTLFTVTWNDNSSDETGFKVYISTVPNGDCSVATYPGSPDYTTAADAVSQNVTGKSINTQYCAKVVTTNANGDSNPAYSSPKYTLANQPDAPTVSGDYSVADGYHTDVTINVNNNPAGTNYWIQYSLNGTDFFNMPNTWQTGTTYTLVGLDPNTQYWFKVKAKNGDNTDTAYSSSGADVTPPVAPLSLNTSNICRTTASTSWAASTGADKYTLSYGTDTGGTNLGTVADITTTNKDLSSLINLTTYYWKVEAISNANGTGAYSSIATFATNTCTAPVAPSDFNGTATSTSQINWTWTDTADDETGWRVENTSHTNLSGALSVGSTSWNETPLSINTAYTCHANVYNAIDSNDSNQATVYTLANVPSAPTVSAVSTGIKIVVNKNSNPDANTRYAIFNQTANKYVKHADGTLQDAEDWQLYADWGDTNGFTNTGLSPNVSYIYQVKAENGDGVATAFSGAATCYSPANVPSAPTVNTPTISSLKVLINQNSNPSGTTYAIYETTTSKYVQANGTLDTSAVWQTYSVWGGASGMVNTGLTSNTAYTYEVKAENGDSVPTSFSSGTQDSTSANLPAAPSDVSIGSIDSTLFTVSWTDNSSNEIGFKVYISITANADCSLATYPGSPDFTTAASATSQAVTAKSINSQYCAKVLATNGGGDSAPAYSTPKYTIANVPSAPTVTGEYTIANGYYANAAINGNNNPAGTNYFLQISTDNITYSNTSAGWGPYSGFSKTGLSPNTQYWFKVKAKNGDNTETVYSASGADVTPPAAPTGLQENSICKTSANVTWIASEGADKYTLSYGINTAASNLGTITDISSTATSLSSLANQTTYYLKVLAISNANGIGAYSSIIQFTTQNNCTGPTPATDFHGSNVTTGQINWIWTNTDDYNTSWVILDANGNAVSPILSAVSSSWLEQSMTANTAYVRQVAVTNILGTERSNFATVYTLANIPGTPVLTEISDSSVNIAINQNNNPANTRYAIYNDTAGKYVRHSDGAFQDNPDWQLYQDWGGNSGFANSGLAASTSYAYRVKARNGDSVETNLSDAAPTVTLDNPEKTVSKIFITPSSATLKAGESLQFDAKAFAIDDSEITSAVIIWKITNQGGTIDQSGSFTAGTELGTFDNTVEASFGDTKATATVIVRKDTIGETIIDGIVKGSESVAVAVNGAAIALEKVYSKIGISKEAAPPATAAATLGLVALAVAMAPASNLITLFSLKEVIHILLYSILSLGAIKKKRKKWGQVLEDGTGMPLSNVFVSLIKIEEGGSEKSLETAVTDEKGMYGFAALPGKYKISARKDKFVIAPKESQYYEFDSNKVYEVNSDVSGLVIPTIMMGISGQKLHGIHRLLSWIKKMERFFNYFSIVLLTAGTILVTNNLIHNQSLLNYLILAGYVLLWAINVSLVIRKSPWSRVVEKVNGDPIGLTLVRIMSGDNTKLIKTAVSDEKGKFSAILKRGRYTILASKEGFNLPSPVRFDTDEEIAAINKKIELTRGTDAEISEPSP